MTSRGLKLLFIIALTLTFFLFEKVNAETRSQGAASIASIISLLLSEEESNIESLFFNYDPLDSQFATLRLDNDVVMNIHADKSQSSSPLTELSISMGEDRSKASRIFFDQQQRVQRMVSILGDATFEYRENGDVFITANDQFGNVEEVLIEKIQVDNSRAKLAKISVLPISQKNDDLESCSIINDPNFWTTNTGKAIFECDNTSTLESFVDAEGKTVPTSLRASYAPKDPRPGSLGIDFDDTASSIAPVSLGLTASLAAFENKYIYDFEVRVPTTAPRYSDWLICCNVAYANFTRNVGIAENAISLAIDLTRVARTATTIESCLVGAVTAGVVGCVVLASGKIALEFGFQQLTTELFIDTSSELFRQENVRTCAFDAYTKQRDSAFNRRFYESATVTFEKSNIAGGIATYSESNVDLTSSELDLSPIRIGPVPAFFRPVEAVENDLFDGIYAFRETGERLVILPNGSVFEPNESGVLVESQINNGERIRFQVLDQFFNRESSASRFDSQNYGCASYTWRLKEGDEQVGDVYVQGANERTVLTDPLEAGQYKVEVCADNSALQQSSDLAESKFTNQSGEVVDSLGASCTEINLKVDELDNCAIERYQLRIAEFVNDYENPPIITTLNPGDPITAENGQRLVAGATRDGEVIIGTIDAPFEDLQFPTVDRSDANVEVDFSFVISDSENSCNVSFPIDLTLQNTAYRTIAGNTFSFMIETIGPFSITFEEDGTTISDVNGRYNFFSQFTQGYDACDGSGPTKAVGVIDVIGLDVRTKVSIGEDGKLTALGCRVIFSN